MSKKDNKETFIDELNSSSSKKSFSTNKIKNIHIHEIWSIDLANFSDYKNSNNKGFRYIFVVKDKFSKSLWCVPLRNKNSQTKPVEFAIILSTSKRSPLKLESDRGAEFYTSLFQNLSKSKKLYHYSGFRDKRPSIAERFIRTVRSLLKKPVFEKGKAGWLSVLPSVMRKKNIKQSTVQQKCLPFKEVKFK